VSPSPRCLGIDGAVISGGKDEKDSSVGWGNGGHTKASDLALKGLEVRIREAPEFAGKFRTTSEQ